MSIAVLEASGKLQRLSATVRNTSNEYASALGPHKQSLDALIDEIEGALFRALGAIEVVSEKLREVAEAYREIINNDRILHGHDVSGLSPNANISNAQVQSGDSVYTGTESVENETANTQRFGSFDIGRYENGDYVVKGDHFEQYISDYYDSDNLSFESFGSNSMVETISPNLIEGIHLGTTEMEDSGRFWGQHGGGTADSFKEIASNIPVVRSQLQLGKTLSEISEYPELSKCVEIYFNPSNIPRVVKSNGYYEFDSNGRHRILAARELGLDIPVRVIGIRTRK